MLNTLHTHAFSPQSLPNPARCQIPHRSTQTEGCRAVCHSPLQKAAQIQDQHLFTMSADMGEIWYRRNCPTVKCIIITTSQRSIWSLDGHCICICSAIKNLAWKSL